MSRRTTGLERAGDIRPVRRGEPGQDTTCATFEAVSQNRNMGDQSLVRRAFVSCYESQLIQIRLPIANSSSSHSLLRYPLRIVHYTSTGVILNTENARNARRASNEHWNISTKSGSNIVSHSQEPFVRIKSPSLGVASDSALRDESSTGRAVGRCDPWQRAG